MGKYGNLGPDVGRVFGELLDMMGVARWTRAQKNAVLQPNPAVWQDMIFAHLARGLSAEQIIAYLKEQTQKFKTFRGIPAWSVFREMERTSINKLDQQHDRRKATKHKAAVDARPQKPASRFDRMCWSIMTHFRGKGGKTLVSVLRSVRAQLLAERCTVYEGRQRVRAALKTLGIDLDNKMRGRIFEVLEESDGEEKGVCVSGLRGRGKPDGEDGRPGSEDRGGDGGARRSDGRSR